MFGKKRGHRHTGSKTLRGAGEAMFFACLLLVGIAFLMLLLARVVIPEWRASHDFREVMAQVDEKKIESSTDRDGNPVFIPKVKIHFDLDGHTYSDLWTYDISVANYLRSHGRDDQWTFNVARTQLSTETDGASCSINSKSARTTAAGTIRSIPRSRCWCAGIVGGSGCCCSCQWGSF